MPIELFPMRKTRKEVTHILISQLSRKPPRSSQRDGSSILLSLRMFWQPSLPLRGH